MRKTKFFKMQSVGNAYVFVDERKTGPLENPEKTARLVSDARFSVGGDGLVLVGPSDNHDCTMRIFNADGTEGAICGNAIRCLGKYLAGRKRRAEFQIETASGVRRVWTDGDIVSADMGKAYFRAENLPHVGLFVMPSGGAEYAFTAVSVGNPHAVAFVKDFKFDYLSVALELQRSGIFPQGVNVEFAIPKENGANVLVVERGSGETYGCGSGACAVAAAMTRYDMAETNKVNISYKGGDLTVAVGNDLSLVLSGKAEYACKGEFYER